MTLTAAKSRTLIPALLLGTAMAFGSLGAVRPALAQWRGQRARQNGHPHLDQRDCSGLAQHRLTAQRRRIFDMTEAGAGALGARGNTL